MSKYVVSRQQVFLAFQKYAVNMDQDTVKQMRDDVSVKLFGRIEKELSDDERSRLLNYARTRKPEKRFCTSRQANTVRNLAFEYAIYYHDYENIIEVNKVTGEITAPESLKIRIQELYKNEGWSAVPDKYRNSIWVTANRKCNSLLHSAGLRETINNKDVFRYPTMSYEEADRLIKQFMQMNRKVAGSKPLGVPNISSN